MGIYSAIDVAQKDLITEASANINENIENDSDTMENVTSISESNISLPVKKTMLFQNKKGLITYTLPSNIKSLIQNDNYINQKEIIDKKDSKISINNYNFRSNKNLKETNPLKTTISKDEAIIKYDRISKLNNNVLTKQNSSILDNDEFDNFHNEKTISNLDNFPVAPKLNKKAKNFRFIASVDNELILMQNVFKAIKVKINNPDLVSVNSLLKNNSNLDPDSDEFFTNLKERLNLLAIYKDALQFIPLKPPMEHYYVSSNYGKRKHPVTGKYRMHHGIDLAGTWQENISVSADGTVVFAGYHGSFGKVIRIKHSYGIMTTYGHLAKINVKKGDILYEGQIIGKTGRTGRVAGSHLHYEISVNGKSQNPNTYIKIGRNLLSRTSLKGLANID